MKHLRKFNEEIGMSMHPNDPENQKNSNVDAPGAAEVDSDEVGEPMVYYFNPNDYNNTWVVMARSKRKAFKYLLDHLKSTEFDHQYGIWSSVDIDDESTYPRGYTIETYGEGEVIEGEVS